MELTKIIKKNGGKFLHLYDLVYKTKNGNDKVYEMISRNDDLRTANDVTNDKVRGAVILAVTNDEKILINKEFRMACNSYIYNLPAGLIEEGETPEEAAKRELFEETGMEMTDIIAVSRPYFTADGYTNERSVMVFCRVKGEPTNKNESEDEEITPMLIDANEARKILYTDENLCGTRTQLILTFWTLLDRIGDIIENRDD